MIIKDMQRIWITTNRTVNHYGEIQSHYTDLRTEWVNAQFVSDELEAKTYGEVTNSVLNIRTDTIPSYSKGDHIYFSEPESTGMVEIDDVEYMEYPPGDYAVGSVKPAYIGGTHIRNPTICTARVVTK